MLRPIFGLVAILAAVVIVAPAVASANGDETKVKIFAPFEGEQLAKGLVIASRVSGSCWIGSAADLGRSDAWRCMSGNEIRDPCFAGFLLDLHVVVCGSPFTNRVVEMNLTSELPKNMGNRDTQTSGLPFALELDDGSSCAMMTGATSTVDGMRANYSCLGSKETVYGEPDRSTALWKIYVRPTGTSELKQANVLVAWF